MAPNKGSTSGGSTANPYGHSPYGSFRDEGEIDPSITLDAIAEAMAPVAPPVAPPVEPELGSEADGQFDLITTPKPAYCSHADNIQPVLREQVEAELGRYLLLELYRARRVKQKRFKAKYGNLLQPSLEALLVTMKEERVSPLEAFFINERDRAMGSFSVQWMSCALIEIIDPVVPGLLDHVRQALNFFLTSPSVLVQAQAVEPLEPLEPIQPSPEKVFVFNRQSDGSDAFKLPPRK